MSNLSNVLAGINFKSVALDALKADLSINIKEKSIKELLALPDLQYRFVDRLSLLISALDDGFISDYYVSELCSNLLTEPTKSINAEIADKLNDIIINRSCGFSNHQLLMVANTFEVLYACGFELLRDVILTTYRAVALQNTEFNPLSNENVRIRMSRIAYNCNEYNCRESISKLDSIAFEIKASGVKGLKGVINYYFGLCKRYSNGYDSQDETRMHIFKSNEYAFPLAKSYLEHH